MKKGRKKIKPLAKRLKELTNNESPPKPLFVNDKEKTK